MSPEEAEQFQQWLWQLNVDRLFGPAQPAGQKNGAAKAEARRPKEHVMQTIADQTVTVTYKLPPTPAMSVDRLVRDGLMTWTSVEAAFVLEQCRYERQDRDKGASGSQHIEVLADIMARGQWRRGDALDFARLNGKIILINGHHRLNAQAKAGVSVEWTIVTHDVRREEEIVALFHTFDTNTRTRATGTILQANNVAETLGVSKTAATALYNATPVLLHNFDFGNARTDVVSTRVIDRRLMLMNAYQNECRALDKAISPASTVLKRKLLSAGAFAVALTTFRYQPKTAERFWSELAENDGLAKGDPRNTYITTVLGTNANVGSAEMTARFAAAPWNAFYQNRKLQFIRPSTSDLRLLGTPVGL